MNNALLSIFSTICGENPGHLWSPGGQSLPCCQRCTGLYCGALIAIALQLWLRPRITKGFLQVHALFLLQLGLFLFPWLPQSALLRSASGTLFAFGVVAFLWPAVSERRPPARLDKKTSHSYTIGLILCAALIPTLAQTESLVSAYILICLTVAGALTLATLSAINLARFLFVHERQANQHITAPESQPL